MQGRGRGRAARRISLTIAHRSCKREYSSRPRSCETADQTGRRGAHPTRVKVEGSEPVLVQRDQIVVLVFEIEQHRYGVDTDAVHEIVRAVLPTRLPKAPAVVIGLVNVRGDALPLIDLRLRFALPLRPVGVHEVFVIVSARGRRCALRADAVRELVRVPRDRIAPAPARSQYAAGTTALDDGLLVICDLDAFLEESELMVLDQALAEATP